MIRVFIDYNLIVSPVPIIDNGVIECKYTPIKVVKEKAFSISAIQMEDMSRTKATIKMSMFPRMIYMEVVIIATTLMSNPFIIPGINMWDIWMTLHMWDICTSALSWLSFHCRSGATSRNM